MMSIEEVSAESINDFTFYPFPEKTEDSPCKSYPTEVSNKEVRDALLQSFLALPPWIQTAIEKDVILKDPRFKERLGDEAVVEIVKVPGGYTVFTAEHQLDVYVTYVPMDYCGPAEFTLEFGPLK